MLVFDSHLDLAWNAVEWKRDLTSAVINIRETEKTHTGIGRGKNTVSYPELRKGEVFCFLATVLTRKIVEDYPPFVPFKDDLAAVAAALSQVDHYRQMVEQSHLRQISTPDNLKSHFRDWETSTDTTPGFILSMEGADPILNVDQLMDWWNLGLRVIGPVHYGVNRYSHGTGSQGGLKDEGRDFLRCMQEIGFVLDVTHLTDLAFSEALNLFQGPILASHHNCRALVPDQRQLTDEQILRLIERKAVIGMAFDNWMLVPDWNKGVSSRGIVTMDAIANHIDHICQLAGSSDHVGIGSDLDGGFGTEQCPADLDTISDAQRLVSILESRGYEYSDIEGIMFRNWVSFFERTLPDTMGRIQNSEGITNKEHPA